MKDIIVFGAMMMDWVVRVDEFPLDGQSLMGSSLNLYFGGKGANQAVACARLGASVEIVGAVGNDEHGSNYLELLKKEGIVVESVKIVAEKTGVAQIQINKRGQNRIVFVPSANHCFTTSDLLQVENKIKNAKLVVTQQELDYSVVLEIIKLCVKHKVPVLLNPAPARPMEDAIIKSIDYITPNETELSTISGMACDNIEQIKIAAQSLVKRGAKTVIATLGEHGALLCTTDTCEVIKPYKPSKVVDTVGAGDSFNGALASCIVKRLDIVEAIKYANAVGAITVSKNGAIPSLPTTKMVKEFLDTQQG